ncbi:hypothetical protein [Clostridium tepidum]|uniref:hypothetical protein n=1 Tax=Clostridium tepidum TaxID=1962263 RepID=UPI0013015AB4|nr:hypothetical protein [Clostridium tepidum]
MSSKKKNQIKLNIAKSAVGKYHKNKRINGNVRSGTKVIKKKNRNHLQMQLYQ